MAIYIEYEGIKGNVTADGYKDHIAVNSFQFGIGRGITMEPGKMSNREATRPTISEITLSKAADTSAVALFTESVTGSGGKKVKIKFVRTADDKLVEFMVYEVEDVLVSGYSVSADAEGEPIESISLSFSKITVTYNDSDKTNKSASPQRTGYDLNTAKKL